MVSLCVWTGLRLPSLAPGLADDDPVQMQREREGEEERERERERGRGERGGEREIEIQRIQPSVRSRVLLTYREF